MVAPSIVQSTNSTNVGPSASLTGVVAGNVLVLGIFAQRYFSNTPAFSSVSGGGATWTKVLDSVITGNEWGMSVFVGTGGTGGSITATASGTWDEVEVALLEIADADESDPVDESAQQAQRATSAPESGATATLSTDEGLALGFCSVFSNFANPTPHGSDGFTTEIDHSTQFDWRDYIVAYKALDSTTGVNFRCTGVTSDYRTAVVVLKPASGGPVEVPLAGELAFSGGVARQLSLGRDVGGVLEFSGAVEEQQSLARQVAGVLALQGDVVAQQYLARNVEGALAFSGAVQAAQDVEVGVSGELAFAGDVAAAQSLHRDVAGALDFAGEIALKFDAKHLFGELAFAGTAEAAQSLFRDVAGAVGFAGAVDALEGGVIQVDIVNNNDDCTEFVATGFGFNSTQAGFTSTFEVVAGMRFRNIAVAQGDAINSATLTLNITTINGSPDTDIYGVDVDDAAEWSNPGNLPSAATKTTANTNFAPTGTGIEVIDVTAIVQEIVNRGGWVSGNDMAFVTSDNVGVATNTWAAEDFNAGGGNEARLTITLVPHVSLGGELGFDGAVQQQQSLARAVSGELSFAGAIDAQQSGARAVAGEIGFTGDLGFLLGQVRLAGEIGFAGDLRALALQSRLAGNLGFAGAIEAAGLSVGLAGELGFAGALDFVRMRGLAGELGLVGTLPQVVTTGTVEIAAVLAESGSIKSTGSYTEARAGTNLSLESGGIVGQTVEDNANAPFPEVSGTPVSSTAAAGASIDVTMPATVEANDLLLMFVSGGDNNSFDAVSGWTQKTNAFGSPNNANLAIYAKKAVGNEDGATVNVTGGGTNQKTALVYRILADTWSQDLDDVVVGTPVLDTNTWFADPPNLSPGYTLNTLWFAVGAIQSGSINPFVDSPDNYGTVQSVSSGGSAPGFHRLGVATRELNAASDNPTRFEVNSAVRQDSVAQTLAVRPAKAAVVYQSFLAWDTDGVVPAGNTLTDAVIELDVETSEGSATYTYDIWQGASAWLPTLATGDFVAGASLDGGTLAASKARADISAGSYQAWTSEAGIAALINLSGDTEFMLASSRQVTGNAPTGNEFITFDLVTNPPRLTLTYQSTASLLGGNLGFSGLITPQQALARAVSGELGFAGAIEASAVARVLFGEVGFSGDVSAQQFMNRALAGVLDFEGRIAQDQGVFVGGELGFAGDLAAFQAAVRLAGELGFAGSIEALMLDIYLSGELSFNGLVRRSGNASGIKPNIGSAGLWTPRAGSGWYSSPKNGSAGFWKPRPGS